MTAVEWLALAERCEKARGPDRDIDEALFLALGGTHDGRPEPYRSWTIKQDGSVTSGSNVVMVKWFTASLDAITALIERELPGCGYCVSLPSNQGPSYATGSIEQSEKLWTYEGWGNSRAATPALAICAAFCRAMAAKETP